MRVATVDIGTNSVLLLVVEQAGSGLEILEQRCEITRLGEAVDRRGALSDAAVERTLAALQRYSDALQKLVVDRRGAVGTAVLRDAANGARFLERAAVELGCPVDVVSGTREAELVLSGVRGSLSPLPRDTVIFDVGGGSTELIAVGEGGALVERTSLDIGCVRLTEREIRSDPPLAEELRVVIDSASSTLSALPPAFDAARERGVQRLIGVAGTATTLASIDLELEEYDSERINGSTLSRARVDELVDRLSRAPLAERRRIAGLNPARADVIVAGALIVAALMDRLDACEIQICDRGVRWGLAHELLET